MLRRSEYFKREEYVYGVHNVRLIRSYDFSYILFHQRINIKTKSQIVGQFVAKEMDAKCKLKYLESIFSQEIHTPFK